MKKTRIVMLTALLLVGVMLLSSCGIGGDSLKLKTLFDGATYVDDSPALSTATEVADLKNAEYESYNGDLALFIGEAEVDSIFYDKYIVYNVKTGTVVFTATESELVKYDVNLCEGYDYFTELPVASHFVVWTTTYTKEGDVVNYDKSTDTTTVYNVDGSQIATAARDTDTEYGYDLLYFEGKVYRVGDDGKFAYAFDYSPLAEFPEIIMVSEDYYLAMADGGMARMSGPGMTLACYDKELNLLSTYTAPSYLEASNGALLANGNFLVQGQVQADPFSEDYDFMDEDGKWELYTLIIDVEKGEAKEIECDYMIEFSMPITDEIREEGGLGDKVDNMAYVYAIENKRINESSLYTGTINNKGEFLPLEKINGMNPLEVMMIAENRWLVGTAEGFAYLVDEKGDIIADISNASFNESGYITCDGKLYDHNLQLLFDYEAEKLYRYESFGNCILFTNDDDELILYANGQKSTLIAKDTEREYMDSYSNEGDYFVICDSTDPAAIKYEVYNNAGAKILTLDYSPESFDISRAFWTPDDSVLMLCVTGWDVTNLEVTYTYYRVA